MTAQTARATLIGTAGCALLAATTWWLLAAAVSSWPGPGPVQVEAGLAFLALVGAGLVAGWAAVLLAAATASLAGSGAWSGSWRRGTAAEARREGRRGAHPGRGLTGRVAAGLLVVASIGAAPATAAGASSGALAPTVLALRVEGAAEAAQPGTASVTDDMGEARVEVDEPPVPGWTPTVTTAEPPRRATGEVGLVSTAATPPAQDEVVVVRGDTLWDIAARHLGDQATAQDVAEAWPLWHAANRDVIGDDPDLIRPGQRLVVPTPGSAR